MNLPDASAIIQILILYLAIYAILKRARGSRFGQVLTGAGILAASAVVFAFIFRFDVLSELIRIILMYLALSTVVIFQPEIRRVLSTVGAFGYLEKATHRPDGSAEPEFVVKTLLLLSELKMGALIAFERGISLRSYEQTGVLLDSRFSPELIKSIFTPPLPLHDGGVTIRDGRVSAAHCVFPVSSNPELTISGMRHRAAVGLSEETDALVIVVSEESGSISVAHNGKIFRYSGEQRETAISRWVMKAMREDSKKRSRLLSSLKFPFRKNRK